MDNRQNLKRLLKSGKEYKCDICNLKKWLNNEIRLQIHHIDGNRTNNNLSNLQLLCPNKEQLILDCQIIKTYSSIAKKYGVSDKTIRK